MTNSLLPPNATRLERALEAGAARILDVDARADINDPMTCPAEVLPWLAWGSSVDSWDADWTEADKRAAVADSIALHRRKGTRMSVEQVLARYDHLARLVEWHEAAPRRHPNTFDVVVPMVLPDGTAPGGRRASAAFAEAIIREVSRVKPLREHMTVVQTVDVSADIGVHGVARFSTYSRQDLAAQLDIDPVWDGYLQTEAGEPLQAETGSILDHSA